VAKRKSLKYGIIKKKGRTSNLEPDTAVMVVRYVEREEVDERDGRERVRVKKS
jgi:hypothetical protein